LTKQLILERDEEGKEPVLEVDKDLVMKLKPHQVEGEYLLVQIKFLNVFLYTVESRYIKLG
jgi:hypothetical protein